MNDAGALEQTLLRLFDTPEYLWLAAAVAFAAGAAHALAPGHGKSIAAAYLVGAHGRVVHAVYLGLVVAAMHTASAIVLALLWQALRAVLPWDFAQMTGGLQIAAAIVVILVGVALVRRRGHGHAHTHDHVHTHNHVHAHAPVGHVHTHSPASHVPTHAHSHTDPDQNPFTWKGLVALGLSGGLVPSPTVFLILVSGLVTGRVALAVLLVALFGIGMMVTISVVGVLTLSGMRLVEGGGQRVAWLTTVSRLLPRVAAYAVIVLGVTYLVVGVRVLTA